LRSFILHSVEIMAGYRPFLNPYSFTNTTASSMYSPLLLYLDLLQSRLYLASIHKCEAKVGAKSIINLECLWSIGRARKTWDWLRQDAKLKYMLMLIRMKYL